MNREKVVETITDRVEAFNAHDPDAIAGFYIEDAVSRDMGRDMALMGRAAIRESLATYFDAFPDVVMGISRISVDGDTAFMEWHAAGTHREPYHGSRRPAATSRSMAASSSTSPPTARSRARSATGTSPACCASSG